MGPARGARLRIAHLTTVDMSLALLLETELRVDLDAGHEVIGMSAPGRYVAQIESIGVRHVALPSLSRSWGVRRDLRAAIELWRAVRSIRPDVLHSHNPKTGVMGRVVGRLAGVPAVVNTCHGLWAGPESGRAKRMAVLAVEGFASRFSHAELFQNAEDRQALRWAVADAKAEVVGNGVDLERFRFDPIGRASVRAAWDVGDGEVLVGAVGRRVAEKGMRELGAAADALHGRARFVWVGPEDETNPGGVHGLPPALQLEGERADMPAVYSAFDVFVLPSYREGFSRSAMEAAACGRAMVLTDIRGCREIGDHGQHMLLVPPRDPAPLIDALDVLISDPALRERLGDTARARAVEAFDQVAVANRSLSTYRRVLGRVGSSGSRSRP